MDDPDDIVVRNLGLRVAMTRSGVTVPITQMFDADGDETEDPSECVTFIGPLPNGQWYTEINADFMNVATVH